MNIFEIRTIKMNKLDNLVAQMNIIERKPEGNYHIIHIVEYC